VIDLMIPVLFYWIRRRRWLKLHGPGAAEADPVPLEPDVIASGEKVLYA